jgi:outer membrane protein, heavy metal efflux system
VARDDFFKLSLFGLCLPFFLGSCSFVGEQEVFEDVRTVVSAQTGYTLQLDPSEQEIKNIIAEALAGDLTLEKAIRLALLNNQSLQAAYEKLGVARGELIEAGLLKNPLFEAEVHFEGGGIGLGTNLNLVQDIISIFQLPLRRKIARAELEAAKYDVAEAVLNLVYDTEAAFYEVQGAAMELNSKASAAESFETSAEIANRQNSACQ